MSSKYCNAQAAPVRRGDYLKGVFFASVSSASYGLNPLFALPLMKDGLEVESILALRYFLGMLMMALFIMLSRRLRFEVRAKELIPLAGCGVMMSLSSLTLYASYRHMDVGIASTLLFVYPIMVAAIMALFFRERMSVPMKLCMILAVAGVAVLNRGGGKAGAAVYLYAGIAKLQTGAYEEAISYLKKYNGEDPIMLARAQACIGDAYVELQDYPTAINWFEKAAKTTDNAFAAAYLLKAGIAAEANGDNAKALACYTTIKDQWSDAPEAMEIDKYITRINNAE